nr:MAG TPA: hypothetical protein [Caudoviricetes sp.]
MLLALEKCSVKMQQLMVQFTQMMVRLVAGLSVLIEFLEEELHYIQMVELCVMILNQIM